MNTLKTRPQFPKHLKNIQEIFPSLLDILEKGHTNDWYSFVWFEESKLISTVSAKTESSTEDTDRGVVFRIHVNNCSYERSTNNLNPENLQHEAKTLRLEVEQKHASTGFCSAYTPISWPNEKINPLDQELSEQIPKNADSSTWIHFAPKCAEDPYTTKLSQLVNIGKKQRQIILEKSEKFQLKNTNKNYDPIADIRVVTRLNTITNIFIDREKRMSQTLPVTLFMGFGFTTTGKYARAINGGFGGIEIAQMTDKDIQEVVEIPLKLSKAKKITPGRYQVITGPDVTGIIAHEAFGHTQEGDTWMKGRSIAKDLYENKKKAGNAQASIINHPNMFSMDSKSYGTNGSYFFDNEGELARIQHILDKGSLTQPMTDLSSAELLGVPRTANGKRESWRRPIMTRQTNTYFTEGEKTLEELIAMVSDGYLARWGSGGMEDPKGGSLTAGTSYFEKIKNGKLTGELLLGPSGGHIELSDPVFTLLDKIVAKTKSSHDQGVPENKFGGCGKYHKESVAAGCGGPYILWQDINCG